MKQQHQHAQVGKRRRKNAGLFDGRHGVHPQGIAAEHIPLLQLLDEHGRTIAEDAYTRAVTFSRFEGLGAKTLDEHVRTLLETVGGIPGG